MPNASNPAKKRLTLPSEPAYLFATALIALSVVLTDMADFGLSMISAPTYVISSYFTALSFGVWEYIVEGALFLILCLCVHRFRPIYLFSFLTGILYGTFVDLWRLIPFFDRTVTPPDGLPIPVRVLLFAAGVLVCAMGVAFSIRVQYFPSMYDFFSKTFSECRGCRYLKVKYIFDGTCLAVSVVLSLCLFRRFVGIGVGTVIITVLNGPLIALFGRLLDRCLTFTPLIRPLGRLFTADTAPSAAPVPDGAGAEPRG